MYPQLRFYRKEHGANRNDSSCFRQAARHKPFLRRSPSFSATACNWFMIRVRVSIIDVKITRSERVQSPAMRWRSCSGRPFNACSTPVLRRQRVPRVLAHGARGYQTVQ